jgi:hypothetical protein
VREREGGRGGGGEGVGGESRAIQEVSAGTLECLPVSLQRESVWEEGERGWRGSRVRCPALVSGFSLPTTDEARSARQKGREEAQLLPGAFSPILRPPLY